MVFEAKQALVRMTAEVVKEKKAAQGGASVVIVSSSVGILQKKLIGRRSKGKFRCSVYSSNRSGI
jgi:hypothetical protein